MQQITNLVFQLVALVIVASQIPLHADIPIVLSPQATDIERLAASELAHYLRQLYPKQSFAITTEPGAASQVIRLGTPKSTPDLLKLVPLVPGASPESYRAASIRTPQRETGILLGAGEQGLMFGVYALLQKMGCGFQLSGNLPVQASHSAFNFNAWTIFDTPLVPDRLVFDWHNFLSGCSTWNLTDWNRWTDQSQKMGYNAIMVHAYGNNPMVSFEFNGKKKPVGYLSTTVKGRDWSTMHVNDVRRLWRGEVFQQPVFGADAGQVPEDQRSEAAQKLMAGVFAHAGQRGMEVYFADDVDTGSANPQELIQTLPEGARFAIQSQAGGLSGVRGEGSQTLWLANPDTPEGYRYYKAQVEALLTAYPQITCLVVWFRNGGTPWMDLKVTEMPIRWQEEYQAEITRTPEAAKFWHSHNLFAIGKITRAFDRALKELGHERIRLAAGTWNFAFLPGADLFLPRHVTLIGLDYGVLHDDSKLGSAEKRQKLAEVGVHRPVIPVIWAHHDDGNYIGRPYTPFADFHTKLTEAKASGFGIIHWTTRPLDLFFASHIRQVWERTQNESLRTTCDAMAANSFGATARETMGAYLERWVTDAPKFARETSDYFIDRPLTNIAEVVAGCRERLKRIELLEFAALTPEQRDQVNYFKSLERFIGAFFETHGHFQDAQTAFKKGDLPTARAAMAECRPEPLIEQFAKFSSLGGITRGEQGLVVSLNTRWLPHIVRLRQQLGLEAMRYRFGPTSHDPLAQSSGRFTFYFDAQRQLWQTLGEEETKATPFVVPVSATGADEIGRSGIESDQPISMDLGPILASKKAPVHLPAGNYQLRLWLLDPTSTAAGQRVFDLATSSGAETGSFIFDAVKARFLRVLCHGNADNDWNSLQEVQLDGLAKDGTIPAVTCSSAVKGFPAQHAIDGNPDTRWATRGTNEWLQFRLNPRAEVRSIGLQWFGGEKRQPRYEVLVSDDGTAWTPVKNFRAATETLKPLDRVDIFQLAGQANKVVGKTYSLTVLRTGLLGLKLTPIQGKALLCGLELEPVKLADAKP
ncbi:MAG: discoidin domain-containing protein [Verrucomicrobiota bacterium]